MNKQIKIIAVLMIAAVSIYVILSGIGIHNQKKEDERILSFMSATPWDWSDKRNRIQKKYNPVLKRHELRKVEENENHIIYIHKNADHTLSISADFVRKCKPGTKVVTSQKYSTGEAKILKCDESGKFLTYTVIVQSTDDDIVVQENLDGFDFYENFFNWNLKELDREVTLLQSK